MTNPHSSRGMDDPLLTTREAAQRLGVSLRTIQLWVEDGKLQAGRTPGGHRRIRASDVAKLAERSGIKPAAQPTDMQALVKLLAGALRAVMADADVIDGAAIRAGRLALDAVAAWEGA